MEEMDNNQSTTPQTIEKNGVSNPTTPKDKKIKKKPNSDLVIKLKLDESTKTPYKREDQKGRKTAYPNKPVVSSNKSKYDC